MTTEERITTGSVCLALYSGLLTLFAVRSFSIIRYNRLHNPASGVESSDLWLIAALAALGVFACACSVGIARRQRWARLGAFVSVAVWLFVLILRWFTTTSSPHRGVGTGSGADSVAGIAFRFELGAGAVVAAAFALFVWLCWLSHHERDNKVA